ncbi:MAG: zf-HC2 domain-containing protein [Deltaproteobacteria bacterium]|nr:zf-HC2 domain-containing protein [Deltaproteobacteria bacterium]MBI3388146.1 zf-HC2 domain-containing protein [Deltaproteobacteria bacterium]
MTCKELTELIIDYVEGDLPSPVLATFEAHLAACPECVAYLQSYRETIALGRAAATASDDSASADVPEELVQAIVAAHAKQRG